MSPLSRRIQPSSPPGWGRVLLTFSLAFAGVQCASAVEWYNDPAQPVPHPTLIAATVDGKAYPVVGVDGEHPQIVVDGVTVTLRSKSQSFQPMRGAAYAPGLVHATNYDSTSEITAKAFSYDKNGQKVPMGTSDLDGYFHGSFTADENFPDCYFVVLYYRLSPRGEPDVHTTALAFGHLGDLKAGQETVGKNFHAYVAPVGQRYYFVPMVFSKGREIRTNVSNQVDRFFRHQEIVLHRELVPAYLEKFKGMDHAAIPYVRVPIQLPEGVDAHTLPSDLVATFSVTESGEVDSIQLGERLVGPAREAIRQDLAAWLFMPRLKQGSPVRTVISMPLGLN